MSIQSYLNNVLKLIELSPTAKKDLHQELDDHANDKISYYQTKGFSKSEAEEKTRSDFGDPKVFAKEINTAYFPFRYKLLILLSILSIIFSLAIGLSLLVNQPIFSLGWTIIATGSSAMLFYFIRKPSRSANNRLFLIGLLIWLTLIYFFGYIMMDGIYDVTWLYSLSLLYILVLIVLSLSQIVAGVIYQPIAPNLIKLKKQNRIINILINTLTGVIVIGISLFYLGGLLIFGAVSLVPALVPLSIIVWIVLVVGELKWDRYSTFFRVSKIVLALVVLIYFAIPQIVYF